MQFGLILNSPVFVDLPRACGPARLPTSGKALFFKEIPCLLQLVVPDVGRR